MADHNNELTETFWLTKFGFTTEFIRFKTVDLGRWPLISPSAYAISIACTTSIVFVIGLLRLAFRYRYKKLDSNDVLFSIALLCSVVAAVLNIYCKEFFYIASEQSVGAIGYVDSTSIIPAVVLYLKVLNGLSAAQWISIYAVKFSYLHFFYLIIKKVSNSWIRIWLWVVLVLTALSCIAACLITLMVCSHIGNDVFEYCTLTSMFSNAKTLNRVGASLDIATDVFIVSFPILLLSKVQTTWRRKALAVTILGLSTAMIVIAIVRLFSPPTGSEVVDVTWYSWLIAFENDIAILMASITVSRNLFHTGSEHHRSTNLTRSKHSLDSRFHTFFTWSTSVRSPGETISEENLSHIRTRDHMDKNDHGDVFLRRVESANNNPAEVNSMGSRSVGSIVDEERGTPEPATNFSPLAHASISDRDISSQKNMKLQSRPFSI